MRSLLPTHLPRVNILAPLPTLTQKVFHTLKISAPLEEATKELLVSNFLAKKQTIATFYDFLSKKSLFLTCEVVVIRNLSLCSAYSQMKIMDVTYSKFHIMQEKYIVLLTLILSFLKSRINTQLFIAEQ